ncbi:MAG: hypothetical protein V1686_01815 [Patescibacteria group bacterium]
MKSKLNIKTISVISCVALICLIVPIATHAGVGETIARWLFNGLASVVMEIAKLFVNLGIKIIDTILKIGFSGAYRSIAESGWKTSQGIANMFFILIMVFIAFATILRIEKYGVKKLLPRLLGVALLINFSLPLTYLMIDISNITARTFVNQLTGLENNLGGRLVDGLRANLMLIDDTCDLPDNEVCPGSMQREEREACWTKVYDDEHECERKQKIAKAAQATAPPVQDFWEIVATSLVSAGFMMLAALVLIAAGLMLIVRLISLAILVILAPLAFICYATPSLDKYAKEWWSNLLKWCFFAPVFTFFFWLAVKNIENLKSLGQYNSKVDGGLTRFIANTSDSAAYFIFLGLILGGMIVAQKLGVTGAAATMGIAKKWQKGATDWAKRKTVDKGVRLGQMAGGAAQRAGGGLIKKIPGFRTYGAKMEVKGKEMQQKMLKAKDVEKAKRMYEQFSPEDLSNAMNSKVMNLSPAEKLALAQVASSDKFKNKIDAKAADRAAGTLKTFGYGKEANDLRDARIDSEQTQTGLESRIDEMRDKGELTNMSAKALEDPRVIQYLAKICKAEELEAIRNKSGKHGLALVGTAPTTANPMGSGLTGMASTISTTNPNYQAVQHAYASQSGDAQSLMARGQLNSYAATAGINAFRRDRFKFSTPPSPQIAGSLAANIPLADLKETLQKADPKLAVAVVAAIRRLFPTGHPKRAMVDNDQWLKSL